MKKTEEKKAFIPTERSPWGLIVYGTTNKRWIFVCAKEKRSEARAAAKMWPKHHTRIVRLWVPTWKHNA